MSVYAENVDSTPQVPALDVVMTAYSSTVDQTDDSPFITSTNQRVRFGIVAVSRDLLSTELPYGTQLKIVDIKNNPRRCGGYTPDVILEVQDTMHKRKRQQIDIWMPSRQDAIQWGRCEATVQVIDNETQEAFWHHQQSNYLAWIMVMFSLVVMNERLFALFHRKRVRK